MDLFEIPRTVANLAQPLQQTRQFISSAHRTEQLVCTEPTVVSDGSGSIQVKGTRLRVKPQPTLASVHERTA